MKYLLGILLLVASACQSRDFYAEKQFEFECWALQDTFAFTYENPAPDAALSLDVSVDFLEEYAFRNLFLKITAISPSGQRSDFLLNDTLQDDAGNWRVERGRSRYPVVFSQPLDVALPEAGGWRFQVIQYMREDTLCEIAQVGVSLRE